MQQNPYNQPNYGQPGYGQPGYGQPGPGQPRGTVSMDVIGEAWQKVSANLGPWIGASAIYLLVTIVFQVIQTRLQGGGSNGAPQASILSLVISIASIFVTQFLIGGMMRMAINTVRTGTADLSLLFSAGNVVLSLVGAAFVTGIAVGIGFLLCIVPGVIAAIGLSMVTPLIVDGRAGAIGALGESWNAVKPHLGGAFVLFLVLFLIMIASAIPCGLGLLVSIPLIQVAIALVYRDLFGGGGMSGQTPGYTPPIANPNY